MKHIHVDQPSSSQTPLMFPKKTQFYRINPHHPPCYQKSNPQPTKMPISFKRMRDYTYEKLNSNEPPRPLKTTFNWQLVIPWALSATLALFSGYLLLHQPATHGAYQTDFADVRPFVAYEERTFTGKFYYNDETQMIEREVDPTKPQYAGPPSPEIDAAWAELLRGIYSFHASQICIHSSIAILTESKMNRRIPRNHRRRSSALQTRDQKVPGHR